MSACAAGTARREGWFGQERMKDCVVVAATRIARFVAAHFESYGLPMTDSDTPVMNEPFTQKALRLNRPTVQR